jgi:hypothetical protein
MRSVRKVHEQDGRVTEAQGELYGVEKWGGCELTTYLPWIFRIIYFLSSSIQPVLIVRLLSLVEQLQVYSINECLLLE